MVPHIEQSEFNDQLVLGLVHRMNNIFGLFHGYLSLLLEDEQLAPETLVGLRRIREGASAAVDLMGRTQSLARPASLVWREIDTAKLIRTLRPSLLPVLRAGVTLEIEAEPDLPSLWADATRLRTALTELVANAAEASPARRAVQLRIFSEQTNEQAADNRAEQTLRWVVFEVTDCGKGIKPGLEEKIYAPFFTTRQSRDAAGLGLAVTAGLVQQMQGVLRHESEPGRTAFRIMLPAFQG